MKHRADIISKFTSVQYTRLVLVLSQVIPCLSIVFDFVLTFPSTARRNQSITMNSPSVVKDDGRRKVPASRLPGPILPPCTELASTREVTADICGRVAPVPSSDEDDVVDEGGGEQMVNSERAIG